VDRRLKGWGLGARIWRGSEIDPFAVELATVQEATPDEAEAATDVIDRCRYASLLWQLRNFRVHEGRSPADLSPSRRRRNPPTTFADPRRVTTTSSSRTNWSDSW
jgi:hypothetical protein